MVVDLKFKSGDKLKLTQVTYSAVYAKDNQFYAIKKTRNGKTMEHTFKLDGIEYIGTRMPYGNS